MQWLKKLFSTDREFTGDFIETGDDLLRLIQSNQVVAAEFTQFEIKIKGLTDQSRIKEMAQKSADSLSGYGISVSAGAFMEVIEK